MEKSQLLLKLQIYHMYLYKFDLWHYIASFSAFSLPCFLSEKKNKLQYVKMFSHLLNKTVSSESLLNSCISEAIARPSKMVKRETCTIIVRPSIYTACVSASLHHRTDSKENTYPVKRWTINQYQRMSQ